jgi:hypothetical protein
VRDQVGDGWPRHVAQANLVAISEALDHELTMRQRWYSGATL